jgi:hypothetical protein
VVKVFTLSKAWNGLTFASKAEQQGNFAKAENYRRQAEQDREKYIDLALK